MPQLAEMARIRNVDLTALPAAPSPTKAHRWATDAWQVHTRILEQEKTRPGASFTRLSLAGTDGWRWAPAGDTSLRSVIKDHMGSGFTDAAYTGIVKYLQDTGNATRLDEGDRTSRWWIAGTFQGVSPHDRYIRDQLAAAAAEYLAAQAAPRLEAADEVDGPIDFDDRTSCRMDWCKHVASGSTEVAAAAIRDHEREAHPGDYWAGAEYGCPLCLWPTPAEENMRAHLRVLHRRTRTADVAALLRQAVAVAARGRQQKAALTPLASPPERRRQPALLVPALAAASAPEVAPSRARLAQVEAENAALRHRVEDLTARLCRLHSMVTAEFGSLPDLPIAAGQ